MSHLMIRPATSRLLRTLPLRRHSSLLRTNSSIPPNLALLLPTCKDLESARNELRWLREHVEKTTSPAKAPAVVTELCRQRGQGVPLQYILGTQPFGSLEILCRPNVLIPRAATESYTNHLLDLIISHNVIGPLDEIKESVNVIDVCTGTGCIPLQVFASLQRRNIMVDVKGVDVSPHALELAKDNLDHNVKQGNIASPREGQSIGFHKADVFRDDEMDIFSKPGQKTWHIMTSNPPYISEEVWSEDTGDVELSVRQHEPRLALVPERNLGDAPEGLERHDIFYSRLLDIAMELNPRILLLEIGDDAQALRVAEYCTRHPFCKSRIIELWRDCPDIKPDANEQTEIILESSDKDQGGFGRKVPIKGSGQLRAIYVQQPIESMDMGDRKIAC
ncbi:S-adenosyl-L-methionine-dependent methyltransferase [Emericellopsis atlantica]|uniref:S-adenosyl-L-methionine-dependent methyltransferase n=1 Tax=Emericellopsis atlantica TaxID=2614577 RepID=A0A9P8CLW6_9HYPO|nr:S-adenosyl-L-methionine-dependent methyltransferase [Emericellopsis atlantica]KAG9250066.1 S-adenosyl-L-methionine-dependent methyltransferase [Emericellopsis atlantica]